MTVYVSYIYDIPKVSVKWVDDITNDEVRYEIISLLTAAAKLEYTALIL